MSDITLNELHKMEMRQLSRERGREPDPNSWRWSPSDIRIWAQMLEVAIEHLARVDHNMSISIWEAGSGIGTKLLWAKQRGLIEYGFELFDYYIAAAKELGVACEQRDLSDLDNQPSWEVPDIVFTARPFKDDLLENKWERLVQDRMRPGAVLISTFTSKKPYGWPVLYRATFRGVWVKPGVHSPEPESVQSNVTVSLPLAGNPPPYPRRRTSRAGKSPCPGKERDNMSIRKAVLIGAMTLGLAGAGTTAAFAGETPTPVPTQQTVTPVPSPYHVKHVRAALWQFDFTGANIDGLQLNDVRGSGPIPMSRWSETDNSPFTSTFTSPGGTSSVQLLHNRLPLPVENLGTCTATFDQIGTFRIINGTGTGANFRVVPGTSEYILRGLISFDKISLRHHRVSVCPLQFVNPFVLRFLVEHNNLRIAGQLPTLTDFDVQGNAQLVRVRPVVIPTPTPTGPGHFFAPTVNPNPDNQSASAVA